METVDQPTIRTVVGPIPSESLGPTLTHEHLVVQWSPAGEPLRMYDDAEAISRLRRVLAEFRSLGGSALVDVTMHGCGRRPELLLQMSSETGVHIIAVTGSFTDEWAPLPERIAKASIEELVEYFVSELTEGIEGTTVRAGGIKCGTGDGRISDGERRVLVAAAKAQARTNAPILTHTTNGTMVIQKLDILESEGADLGKVLIGHLGLYQDLKTELEVAQRGAYLGFDTIGNPNGKGDEEWCASILTIIDAGYADRILLSHDAIPVWAGPEMWDDIIRPDYNHVLASLVPELERAGVTDDLVQLLLIDNPRRLLQF